MVTPCPITLFLQISEMETFSATHMSTDNIEHGIPLVTYSLTTSASRYVAVVTVFLLIQIFTMILVATVEERHH